MPEPTATEKMEVPTPERVALSLHLAGLGPRCLAYLVDLGVFVVYWLVLLSALTLFRPFIDVGREEGRSIALILALLSTFGVQYVYWTVFEWRTSGQSIGKFVVGIRVVRADGSPVGFIECAVRNLCRAVDFLPLLYGFGVLAMLLGPRPRRLGDLAAGTIVVRDEQVNLEKYLSAPSLEATRLSPEETELLLSFLARCQSFDDAPYRILGERLLLRFAPQLSLEERRALLARRDALEAELRRIAGGASAAAA